MLAFTHKGPGERGRILESGESDGCSPNSQKASKTCVSALLRMLATLARHAGVPGIGNGRMVEDDGEGLILFLDSQPWCFACQQSISEKMRREAMQRAMILVLV